ncbi:D-alanyl-D-alanine carboxypeptidase/D-alanyl-D-alanine-endopeptidase [Nocardioides sp.]|uniref:D-alanyl-D-alanine carboxypeptidase/D-alanyl-D-alanine endopeptidase n=1 Tax=Nocardioides sp. TaxID=35761 RepID=UPI0037831143
MAGRDARHRGRLWFWLPVGLVLAILAAASTAYLLDRGDEPPPGPAAIPPPAGLVLPAVRTPAPVAEPASGTPDPRAVRRAVAGPLADADLGPHVVAVVAALDGTPVYQDGSGTVTPASTLKLLTATAALQVLGPDHTFDTSVVRDGRNRVVLVGGGDPLLSAGGLRTLATRTAAALGAGARPVRLGYDTSLFTGPDVSPHWPPTYVPEGVVSPIQSLWVDEGRDPDGYGRVPDPAATAAAVFAAALAKAGVPVSGAPAATTARAGAQPLATLASQPLSRIVEHTLETSDNEAAEVLSRHVGLATSGQGSFEGGARGVLDTLAALGVPTRGAVTYDGSGLSREDRLDPATLTSVLETAGAAEQPALRSVLTGLPVAGFTGSLEVRFDATDPGRGFVQAKTGTLTGVSGLAGIVTDRTGTPLLFAFLADRIDPIDTLGARSALDDVTNALAACRCGTAGTVAP